MSSVNVDSSLAIISLKKKSEISKKKKTLIFDMVLTVFHFPKEQEKYGK